MGTALDFQRTRYGTGVMIPNYSRTNVHCHIGYNYIQATVSGMPSGDEFAKISGGAQSPGVQLALFKKCGELTISCQMVLDVQCNEKLSYLTLVEELTGVLEHVVCDLKQAPKIPVVTSVPRTR